MFGRRKKGSAAEDAAGEAEQVVDGVDSEADENEGRERVRLEPEPRPDGPWDGTEVRDPSEGRVDLGGLFVPGVDGMELRVEVAGDAIVAATVVLKDSAVQLQAFAAPKREGIWGEVREEIASGSPSRAGSSTRSKARWAGSCGPRCPCSCRTARAVSRSCASSAWTAPAGSCAE